MLGVKKAVYYGLDEVAAQIWDLIQTPAIVADVRDTIVSEFEVDVDTCERDLVAFLSELDRHGMINVVDERHPEVPRSLRP